MGIMDNRLFSIDPTGDKKVSNVTSLGLERAGVDAPPNIYQSPLSKLGDSISGMFGKLKDYGNTDSGKIMAQSILDLDKRVALQPVLETEALFKAFGKNSDLSSVAEKGALGADPLSDYEEASTLQAKRDQEAKINDLVNRILSTKADRAQLEIEKLRGK